MAGRENRPQTCPETNRRAKQRPSLGLLRQRSIQDRNSPGPLDEMTGNRGGQLHGRLLCLIAIIAVDSYLKQIGVFKTLSDVGCESLGQTLAPQGQFGLQFVPPAKQPASELRAWCGAWVAAGCVACVSHAFTVRPVTAGGNLFCRSGRWDGLGGRRLDYPSLFPHAAMSHSTRAAQRSLACPRRQWHDSNPFPCFAPNHDTTSAAGCGSAFRLSTPVNSQRRRFPDSACNTKSFVKAQQPTRRLALPDDLANQIVDRSNDRVNERQ